MCLRSILTSLFLGALCLFLPAAAQNHSSADFKRESTSRMPVDGTKIYQEHCANCHGMDGRGHGPAAAGLKHPVPDLTLISQKNNGKFPYSGVRNLIEGVEVPTRVHGVRAMPVWGPIFHEVEADQDWGEVRLDSVTRHIESMQTK
jgi:mono/diheme cytochrome c family protein